MTHLERSGEMTSDPDGSIFLPEDLDKLKDLEDEELKYLKYLQEQEDKKLKDLKTNFTEQKFQGLYSELLFGRGIGTVPENAGRLYEEIEEIKAISLSQGLGQAALEG
jgi:hypothetical protein